jgi:hypothetical protein
MDGGSDEKHAVDFMKLGNLSRKIGRVVDRGRGQLLQPTRATDSPVGGGFNYVASKRTRRPVAA